MKNNNFALPLFSFLSFSRAKVSRIVVACVIQFLHVFRGEARKIADQEISKRGGKNGKFRGRDHAREQPIFYVSLIRYAGTLLSFRSARLIHLLEGEGLRRMVVDKWRSQLFLDQNSSSPSATFLATPGSYGVYGHSINRA